MTVIDNKGTIGSTRAVQKDVDGGHVETDTYEQRDRCHY
jgi:hypothetical protein